jgi:replicative DNA helicase
MSVPPNGSKLLRTPGASASPNTPAWRPPSPASTGPRQPRFERVSEIFQRVKQAVQSRTATPELPFGMPELDEITRGLLRGKITVIAARSSQGKTSFALQTAWHLADQGKTVAYLTLEDDREELVERLYCHVGRVDNQALRRGEWPMDNPAIPSLFERLKLLVLDDYGYNVQELAHVVNTLSPTPDVVVVDYAQMIDDDQVESEYRAISLFVRHLKLFAEQSDIAVILCSQINRQGAQEGRPSLHHLARCGRLEEVANLVLLLYWPFITKDSSFDYQSGIPNCGFAAGSCPADYFEVLVEKNKTGPKGIVRTRFVGKHYRFEPWLLPLEAQREWVV